MEEGFGWQPLPEGDMPPHMQQYGWGEQGFGGGGGDGWGGPGGMMGDPLSALDADELVDDYDDNAPPPPMPEGPCIALPCLSVRQPFASLMLHGVKQLEARNRPALKQLSGPLALHVSPREEPFNSPLTQTAVAILRRHFNDEAISQLFALPSTLAQGHGCIVGIVDIEATWPADLFNEIEQAQLTEQAVFPVGGTFITQLRNPRFLKYPVRASGSTQLWTNQIPLDALPDGTEVDANGNLILAPLRNKPPLYQPGGASLDMEGDLGLGLLGGDMVRQLGAAADGGASEKDKKLKKLQKALRQIEELKLKQSQGIALEKTQEGKIEREEELRAELEELRKEEDQEAPSLPM